MNTAVGQAQPVASALEVAATPFEQVSVTLSRQDHVQLVMQAYAWKSMDQRAVARIEQQRQQYSQAIERIKALEQLVQEYERVRLREAELREQLIYSFEQARRQEMRLHSQHACDHEKAQQQASVVQWVRNCSPALAAIALAFGL
jgi:hypothetical protein